MASRGETDVAAAHSAYLALNADLAAATSKTPQSPSRTLPPVPELSRSTAEALLSWIRCSTDGNGLTIGDDGRAVTVTSEEWQKLWGEHAPRVLQLLKDVGQSPSSDPELQQLHAEAIMYSLSSKGLVEAFVSGKASTFSAAVSVLTKKFPEHDNGVAWIFLGSYYLAAPWPIRSTKKARESYEKALKINGRSRRNVFYAGLGRLQCGDKKGAAEMFRKAVSDEHCENASPSEKDIAVSLREQAKRGLDFCEKKK